MHACVMYYIMHSCAQLCIVIGKKGLYFQIYLSGNEL